jgi:hypothetical protein
MRTLSEIAYFSPHYESMLRSDFHLDHPLPVGGKLNERLCMSGETYNASLHWLHKAFEHFRVLLVTGFSVSLPPRQPRLHQSDIKVVAIRRCGDTYLLGIYCIQWKTSTK